MASAGDAHQEVQNWRRAIGTDMDALGYDLDQALGRVPSHLRAAVRAAFDAEDGERHFARPGATIRRGGPRPWFADWDPATGYYWPRLRAFLIDRKGRSPREIDTLDESSDNVLQYLEDPRNSPGAPTDFRVQGLVLGYVQSGKTANFTAVIAKSADVGYRLVIVLAGIHNSLRSQTQRRLDLELGLIADPRGVGHPDATHAWWRITSSDLDGDFKPGTDAGPLRQGSRGIMVIKKNATVLRRLVEWLDERDLAGLPVLVVDDEADQASINTAQTIDDFDLGAADTGDVAEDKEVDPSTINGLIRQLLGQFRRVSYVAYTATPFANVLIDPDVDGVRFGSDLFPSDFIVSLPRSAAYVGAERIFGRPALESEDEPLLGLDITRIVPDTEVPVLVPKGKAAASWEPVVTDSLETAILDWMLATAAKVTRLGDGISSMLIHTTQRIQQQNQLAEVVEDAVRTIRTSWRYDSEVIRGRFIDRWNTSFRPITAGMNADLDVSFTRIEPTLAELLRTPEAIRVLVLNSSSREELSYEDNPTLKVILIGGNRLSRGLTLEDLTVSFYLRESMNYDTLLQMGRWFGYRADYVDLTRLWTTAELVTRFRHLSLVEEDLRDQIKIYEREHYTPRDVAPRIRAHPAMLVTAKNRMGTAETIQQSYAGQLLQTIRFRLGNETWLEANVEHTRELLRSLGPPTGVPQDPARPGWHQIPWQWITGFLNHYRTSQDAMSFDADTAARYIQTQAENHGELTTWTVAVRSGNADRDLGTCDLGIVDSGAVNTISRSRLSGATRDSIGVLTSPPRRDNIAVGDEAVDLTDDQIAGALEAAADPTVPVGFAARLMREPTHGLLLIYPISPRSRPRHGSTNRQSLFEDGGDGHPVVIGVALSFPPSQTGATVEYIAGRPSNQSSLRTDDD